MRSVAVVLLFSVASLARPISHKVILDEPIQLDLPSQIDENKLGQAMLEATHDEHYIDLTEEQKKDEQLETLLHGFQNGQPSPEELEGMGITAHAKDWKAEMKAKLFDYEH